jgi:uncharacterized membrane protein
MDGVFHWFHQPGRRRARAALLVLAGLLFVLNLLVYHDCGLYQTPIAKVLSVEIKDTQTVSGALEIEERQYDQVLTCEMQNGEEQGEKVVVDNTYTDTCMEDQPYRKGDFLFVGNIGKGDGGVMSAEISGQKRDYFLSFLLSLLLFGAAAVAGERGFAFVVAFGINIGMVVLGFFCFQTGLSFSLLTLVLILLFSVLSLGLCIGWNRRMLVTLADTLASVGVLAAIYCLALKAAPKMDYTLLDYIQNGTIDLEELFTCGTLLGSLGAIMDVAVSITSGVAEILKKEPDISDRSLAKSVRQIGYDVMGTMINVLFYTYLVGRIPICIAQLANGVRMGVLFRYYLVYEVLRFLAGAIGIVLCVPISETIARNEYRRRGESA